MTIIVSRNQAVEYSMALDSPIKLGRQDPKQQEPDPYSQTPDKQKLVIANFRELTISRNHALLEPLKGGKLGVKNISAKSIVMVNDDRLLPGDRRQTEMPVLLTIGDRVVRVEQRAPPSSALSSAPLMTLALPTMAPGRKTRWTERSQHDDGSARLVDLLSDHHQPADVGKLLRWLQNTMNVFNRAATTSDFLPQAVRAVAENVNLDSAAVLTWKDDVWKTENVHVTGDAENFTVWKPSQTLLEQVRVEKRTFRQLPGGQSDTPDSLVGVAAYVASPILSGDGDVIGAIYGDRRRAHRYGGQLEITELEAMLVELLACGVSAGLARLDHEREAIEERVRFGQFFGQQLAQQLEVQPDLLVGKDADVTVLFCDIRGFSAVTEKLGAKRSIEWINDALGELSRCVLNHHGVLVDYVGDELMAMWGAPESQPDHAQLACQAALDMVWQLPQFNERWEQTLGGPMRVGIGINSGMAQVGNVGSSCRFKYGALGNVVNLGSRTQGATKHAKCNLLITGQTAAKLDDRFHCRRLCSVRVVNIDQPIDLFELAVNADEMWCQLKSQYESALKAFENGEFLSATRTLGNLVEQHPHDGPTLTLLSRTVRMLANPPEHFDPVWELGSK